MVDSDEKGTALGVYVLSEAVRGNSGQGAYGIVPSTRILSIWEKLWSEYMHHSATQVPILPLLLLTASSRLS